MNKQNLIKAVATRTGLTQAATAKMIEATIETMNDTLKNGEHITIMGFGSFMVREAAQRRCAHPITHEPITIPSRRVVRFRMFHKS